MSLLTSFMQLNRIVPGFSRALPGFRTLEAVDGPSALYPGTTVISKNNMRLIKSKMFWLKCLKEELEDRIFGYST